MTSVSQKDAAARRARKFGEDCIDTVIEHVMLFVGYRNYMSDVQCAKMAAALRVMADEFESDE